MLQNLFFFISVFLFVPVVDSKWSLHSAFSTIRNLFTLTSPKLPLAKKTMSPLKLPEHTVYPEVMDGTTFKMLVISLGLIHESHDVVTKDGYVLNLNRILNPKMSKRSRKGPPILLVNGLMMQSDAWILQSNPHHSVAIAWLQAGYDVWLGDQRGTMRSRRHLEYTDKENKFWDFTYHEVGIYDLPAFIDYVLEKTGYPKLVYSGLSLGGTFFFVMCSELPEYQDKLYGSVQFVPVVVAPFIYQMPPQTQMAIATIDLMMKTYRAFGVMYIRSLPLLKTGMLIWCNKTVDLWIPSFDFGIGKGGHYNRDDFCYQLAISFGGTSVLTALHTIQLYKTGKFQRFDYGFYGNLRRYGSLNPPSYQISRVRSPIAVYYTDVDVFAPQKAVEKLLPMFSGPKYGCIMKGLSHVSVSIDSRFGYFIDDLVEVVDSMTGRSNITKLKEGETWGTCPQEVSVHG